MSPQRTSANRYQHVIEHDAATLHARIADDDPTPIILWGHREVGRADLVEEAARAAGRPFRQMESRQLESWDGLRDVSDSGAFRAISIDKLLEAGEPVEPSSYDLRVGEVLYVRGLNRTPTRLLESVFRPFIEDRMLLNNPLPDGVLLVAGALPTELESARFLLGSDLEASWSSLADRSSLEYPVQPLPEILNDQAEHWAVLPSVARFTDWGRRKALSDEVIGYLEEECARDPKKAGEKLFAAILRESDPFNSLASPRSFAELASLLSERRLYFGGRSVKLALNRAEDSAEFARWLRDEMPSWDPDRWIEADAWNTLRGESVTGNVWLRHVLQEVASGASVVELDELANYAAIERRSIRMWATQELGDELGPTFVERALVTANDIERLASG